MTNITIQIIATVDIPDGTPPRDYVRAVGNYLVDVLPTLDAGIHRRQWAAGREAFLTTVIRIEDDEL